MSRRTKKSNYQKLKEAHIRVNELEATLVAFSTGELPRCYNLQQKMFQQYGDRLAEYDEEYGVMNNRKVINGDE